LEGINRKIKTLKRTCYGFANQKFFFLRIDCIFS
ncbi:TPA: transposase, partial [Streptococcus pyogenes]